MILLRAVQKKRNGKLEIFTGMYLLVFLVVILGAQLQMRLIMTTSACVEDALAASNLASAIIDVQEYGKTNTIKISTPKEAYRLYLEALKQNLCLNENWESAQTDLICGPVEVLKYEIYNVEKKDITIYSYGTEGEYVQTMPNGLGSVCTPDGILVESTSVYSKIAFPVKGILGLQIDARKDKTVDIVGDGPDPSGGV